MSTEEKTAEQLAAEQAAAQAEAEREARAEAKAAAKAAKDEEAAKKKAEREARAEAKAAAKAAKEANRQPEQNGVRRPGPEGKCGKAWAIFDRLSAELKQPVPIADALKAALAEGQNEANVRTEYARWKKFHGIAGRVAKPAQAETNQGDGQAAA